MNVWVYRAIVNGEVVFEQEVRPGAPHDKVWAAMREASDAAR